MKFTPDSADGNVITAYEPGEIRLRNDILRNHAIISQSTIIRDWAPAPLEQLSIADFAPVLELQPEIILFGTGIFLFVPSYCSRY